MRGTRLVRYLLGLALVFAMAGVAACGDEGPAAEGSGDSGDESGEVTVLLPSPEGIAFAGLSVGQELGYFKQEGINVDAQALSGSGFTVQQLLAGKVSFIAASAAEAVVAYSKNPSLRAVYCPFATNVFRITTQADSGISGVDGFDGDTIGISEASGGEVPFLKAALDRAGLEEGDGYQLLSVGEGGPATLRALESGEIAGYTSNFIDVASLEAAGLSLVDITPADLSTIPGPCLLTTEEILGDSAKRAEAEALARAWSKGAVYSIANPERALELACEAAPEDCRDKKFGSVVWDSVIELSGGIEGGVPPGAPSVKAFQAAADLLAEAGTIEELDVTRMVESPETRDAVAAWQDYDVKAVERQARRDGG